MPAATKPGMKDIMVSGLTYDLLKANGKADHKNGIAMYKGWDEICEEAGYFPGRTPAREAYEDGWYEP